MFIGVLKIDIHIPESQSLKMKRSVVNSLIMKLRNQFKASIAETYHLDSWQRAEIGIAMVNNDSVFVEKILNKIIDYIQENMKNFIILSHKKQLLNV